MGAALFLMLVSLVQGKDCLFQVGRRVSVHVLFALHGGNDYAMSAYQLFFVVLGRRLDALSQKIFGNHFLDIVSMGFLGRNPSLNWFCDSIFFPESPAISLPAFSMVD